MYQIFVIYFIVYFWSYVLLTPVICLILPWLHMDRELQVSQLQALSFNVLTSCAYRVAQEAAMFLSNKNRRNKAALSEFIVHVLRTSLYAVERGSTLTSLKNILLRLRLTPNPSILCDHDLFLAYLQTLLEPAVFTAFTVNAKLTS